MDKTFKPQGYNSLSPYFIVSDAQKFLDFVKELFDGKALRRYDNADGSIMHAEVRIDDSIIMFAQARQQYPATSFWIHVYVADAMATFQKAIAMGCESIEVPEKKENDPDTRGTFKDFAGGRWAVGTQAPS